jgi:hypothetical protein
MEEAGGQCELKKDPLQVGGLHLLKLVSRPLSTADE